MLSGPASGSGLAKEFSLAVTCERYTQIHGGNISCCIPQIGGRNLRSSMQYCYWGDPAQTRPAPIYNEFTANNRTRNICFSVKHIVGANSEADAWKRIRFTRLPLRRLWFLLCWFAGLPGRHSGRRGDHTRRVALPRLFRPFRTATTGLLCRSDTASSFRFAGTHLRRSVRVIALKAAPELPAIRPVLRWAMGPPRGDRHLPSAQRCQSRCTQTPSFGGFFNRTDCGMRLMGINTDTLVVWTCNLSWTPMDAS